MFYHGVTLLGLFLAAHGEPGVDLSHDQNALFRAAVADGLTVGGKTVRLSEPTFTDGQSAAAQRKAFVAIAGSERAADGMLRDSVTAPHILRLHDTAAEGQTIRAGDASFVVRAELDRIDPAEAFAKPTSAPVEAGNMRFDGRVLSASDLEKTNAKASGKNEWYSHTRGRLLDRIAVESTSRVVVSRSSESIIVAARTDPRFDHNGHWPNQWSTIKVKGSEDVAGPAQPYAGGVGYVKITKLKGNRDALIVETHFAFAEPKDWFGGGPILRSKLGIITEDQIRRLRRELAKPANKTR
jgi:hypothetical protein